MSHLNPGLISAYNSLTDKHLAGYFSNTRIRRHLQRAGLITRSGRIVPDKEYRHKLIQRAHQRHVRECLAQAIFHKVLEMERVHQIEIKRRLEEFARRERVHKIKLERSKRYEEDLIRILSPRPPTGARGIQKQHSGPEGEHSESSESPGSSRPNTAPGKMQRPVRLKPIHSNSTTASLRRSSPYRLLESSNDNDQLFSCTMEKECRSRWTTKEASHGISPYCLPVINNFVTPVPPATKRKERGGKVTLSGTLRGRRLRATTASSGADVNEDSPMLRSSVHQSRVCVNMMYFGKTVHLAHDLTDMRDEVKVFQQHCGGENLCVYKGLLREGETFQFISRRHRGFPFSLTFFLNGLQVERLSSCCEFKHRRGSRLGGRHGHFGFSSVEGASPCYKCIIAVGLDKKPTPPPKRVKEDGRREGPVISPKDALEMKAERTGDEAASHSENETMETQVKEETAAEDDRVRDDYEEDFEADDEGPVEDEEKKSPSPSREKQRQVKERETSETEEDEKDEDIRSRSGSSSSGSDREDSDAEDPREDEKAKQAEEVDEEETVVPPDEKDEAIPEEAAATEAESAAAKDSDVQNNGGDGKETDISDTSVPAGNENKPSADTSGDREAEKTVDERKQDEEEEEEEEERAKSVQEKLAEDVPKESQLSNTSTEEESTDKSPEQDNKDAVPEKSVTFTEQQHKLTGETMCEEGPVGEAEAVVQNQGETSDPKEREDETEQEPRQSRDSTKDEEDEKAAAGEDTAENDKLDDSADPGLQTVSEEEMAEDDKTSEPQEEAAAKPTDGAEEDEEKTAVEADTHPDETGQGAKSSEEDESLASEPNKKTDETAAAGNAEAEAMTASETMEMKADPSEEREALSCEEGPVTNTEKRQRGDSEDTAAESETAENSGSSLEGSGDTTVEKTAETSEDNVKDESNKGDIKKEEVSAVDARKDENQQERCDLGEEETEKSVERDDNAEEDKEEEKQINPDEIAEGDKSGDREVDDETEEEDNNKNKTEERVESKENISELIKTDSNTEGKAEEQAEKTHSEDKAEKADEPEKTEKDEDSECPKNENDVEESEEKVVDKANEGEKIDETNTAADEEKDDEGGKDQDENKAEQNEAAMSKDDEGREEKKDTETIEGEGKSETAEEPEKAAHADSDKDDVKISDENTVESEDVGDSEAANVAEDTLTTEETLNNEVQAEDAKKESERGSRASENGEIDAENGEISNGAENKICEVEAQSEGKNDEKTAEEEIKMEEPTEDESTEVQEETVESGDGAERHEDAEVDQAAEGDVGESGAKEKEEKRDESPESNCEPETPGEEIQEESKSETKQGENGKISDGDDETRDNVQSDVNEVIAASSGDQVQSSTPIAVDLDGTAHKLDGSPALSDVEMDKHPHADENAAAVDLSGADGEHGDTEEASKASEEGASVLLKPPAQPSQNNEAENTAGKETPEALTREDSTDLVSNWVTKHQTSKFFETFVEPLEDLKEPNAQASNSSEEATPSTELPRSASPLKMSENAEQEQTAKDVNESREKSKEVAVESEPGSNQSADGEPCEKNPNKDTPQEEETEVQDLIPEAESEQHDKESVKGRSEEHKGSRASLEEDAVQEGLMQDTAEKTVVSKTEVESIAGTHRSVTSGRPESISENQTVENGPGVNEIPATVEEATDPLPPSEKEERPEHSTSPEGLSEPCEKSREVTEITAFTASRSDDGSQEESHHRETEPKPSDESINGDRRDVQLIRDIQHTLSKERLSTFLVDETLFGPSSYPLLAAARTESGH
ncbi:glutamate-rich protein 3 isoform X2 [Chaetodon trifascialis]|uniref:glutamate-rich protein 3 isoform X2 n=1 Tax=Chaetodon trifascialis TaxID=109706 RepID=UPI0039940B51